MEPFEQDIKVIEKTSKSYSIEGKTGISRKVRALVGHQILEFKFNDETINIFDQLPPKGECTVLLELTSPREKLRLDIIQVL